MNNNIGAVKPALQKGKKSIESAARLEEAVKNLETFWARFQRAKANDRTAIMPEFYQSRAALLDLSQEVSYVVDRLSQLEKICCSMADPDLTNLYNYSDDCGFASGSVEVALLRFELRYRRLIPKKDSPAPIEPERSNTPSDLLVLDA